MNKSLLALLLSVSLTGLASAQDPYQKALKISKAEWHRFGHQTIDINNKMVRRGGRENEEKYYKRVGDYWKQGVERDLDGKDQHVPWSAAFISWVMKEAGFGDRFSYSDWHATYIRNSIFARKNKNYDFPFWGYRLHERAPQVGDLVGYRRQGGITFDYQPLTYSSHTDLVVAVRPGEIEVIGGNVQDSVTKKILRTDANGLLIDKYHKWFVVLAPTPKKK